MEPLREDTEHELTTIKTNQDDNSGTSTNDGNTEMTTPMTETPITDDINTPSEISQPNVSALQESEESLTQETPQGLTNAGFQEDVETTVETVSIPPGKDGIPVETEEPLTDVIVVTEDSKAETQVTAEDSAIIQEAVQLGKTLVILRLLNVFFTSSFSVGWIVRRMDRLINWRAIFQWKCMKNLQYYSPYSLFKGGLTLTLG